MLPINPTSTLPLSNPPILSFPQLLSPSFATFRCRAAADNGFPRSWFNSAAASDAAAVGIGNSSPANVGSGAATGSSNGKANAKERWARDRESYMTDDDDALPLPMTHPNSAPVSPEEIDKRLSCDPVIEVILLYLNVYWPSGIG